MPPTPPGWGRINPKQPQLALLGSFLPNSASNGACGRLSPVLGLFCFILGRTQVGEGLETSGTLWGRQMRQTERVRGGRGSCCGETRGRAL